MQCVLCVDLWREVAKRAKRADTRQVAIAYVTQDFVGLRKGDTLIVDASRFAIASNETSASLLQKLHRAGVAVYDCPSLHAKLLLLGSVAVVGSANMSSSSAHGLVEAAVLSDEASVVSAVASLIEQLRRKSRRLRADDLDALCRIEVIRRGRPPVGGSRRAPKVKRLGNQVWMVGVRELVRDPNPREQKAIDSAHAKLKDHFDDDDEPAWIRWSGRGHFVRDSRAGDSLITIWRSAGAKRPSKVFRAIPVLLKQRARTWTRFYTPDREGRTASMTWGRFQRLLKELGYTKRVGPATVHLLDPAMAQGIERRWPTASKK